MTSTSADLAINSILSITNLADLNKVQARLREHHSYLQSLTRFDIRVGQTVKFDAKTRGIIVGKVMKINQKSVKVKCDRTGGMWKVSPSLLSPFQKVA